MNDSLDRPEWFDPRTGPPQVESFLGEPVELHPGEGSSVDPDDPAALAAARHFRDVLGRFCSGVTVLTTLSSADPVGMTCQSFSSVSLNPPLVLVCPARTSATWSRIRGTGVFCVNLLAAGQRDLANRMAARTNDKFAGVTWTGAASTGSPVLDGTLGHIDCRLHSVHPAGDHYVVIGAVEHLAVTPGQVDPLLYFQGEYRCLA